MSEHFGTAPAKVAKRRLAIGLLGLLLLAGQPAFGFFCMNFGFGSGNGARNRHALPPIQPPPAHAFQPAWYFPPPPAPEFLESPTPASAERKPAPFPESVWPPKTHIQSEER